MLTRLTKAQAQAQELYTLASQGYVNNVRFTQLAAVRPYDVLLELRPTTPVNKPEYYRAAIRFLYLSLEVESGYSKFLSASQEIVSAAETLTHRYQQEAQSKQFLDDLSSLEAAISQAKNSWSILEGQKREIFQLISELGQ